MIDSGPIILQLRSHQPTVRLLRNLGAANRLAISAMTRVEIHARMQPKERFVTQKLLSRFTTYDLDRQIADRTGDLIALLRSRGQSIAMADAVIAATALAHNLTLVTFNGVHFRIVPGLRLYSIPDAE